MLFRLLGLAISTLAESQASGVGDIYKEDFPPVQTVRESFPSFGLV